MNSQTLDHVDPLPPAQQDGQAALVAVFPRELAVPVPPPIAPVGRKWFAAQGLADQEVSSAHIQFSTVGEARYVRDVGSRNGTWLDGQRLSAGVEMLLCDGAVLRLGRTVFVYRDSLAGSLTPSEPLGEMVGPYGLRRVAAAFEALRQHPPANVLIEGETGTGKELVARHIARELGRAEPYAAVNVTGVAQGVFESQLFGHVAGAFSSAERASKGVLVAHDGGAVFLDEIGDLPLELQPKLLRVLDNREVLPVGSDAPLTIDVLLVAATNRPLTQLVEQGGFRQDLYARLATSRIQMAPLRARREDIFAIARALAPRLGLSLSARELEVEAVERLLLEPWPTNVRGLIATLSQVAALGGRPGLRLWALEQVLGPSTEVADRGEPTLTLERVHAVLDSCGGNESQAAKRLGISRGKLRRFVGKA